VEVSSAADPIVAPSLLGRAPGWPTTDLLVVNDNNKAQRNMGVGPTTMGGWFTRYALIHNAATIRRDIVLTWSRLSGAKQGANDRVTLVGGRPLPLRAAGKVVVPNLLPGEHRWVRLTLEAGKDPKLDALVAFSEMVGTTAVNGFAVAAQLRSSKEVSIYLLERAASVYTRLQAFGVREAGPLAKMARTLLKDATPDKRYLTFVRDCQKLHPEIVKQVSKRLGRGDPFGLGATLEELNAALKAQTPARIQSHHGALLEAIDSILTTLDKRQGDLADICQNLRWQIELFSSKRLSGLRSTRRLLTESAKFVENFATRKVSARGYPGLMKGLLGALNDAATLLKSDPMAKGVDAIRDAKGDAKTLQRRHWEYLAVLADLVAVERAQRRRSRRRRV